MSNKNDKAATAASGARVRLVTIAEIRKAIENDAARSAWARGVRAQALDFCDDLEDWAQFDAREKPGAGLADGVIRCQSRGELVELLRNGADDWSRASWGRRAGRAGGWPNWRLLARPAGEGKVTLCKIVY